MMRVVRKSDKDSWVLQNKDNLSACFDDGIVTETCKQCQRIYCKNYMEIHKIKMIGLKHKGAPLQEEIEKKFKIVWKT